MNWIALVKALAPIIVQAAVPHGEILGPIVADAIGQAEQLPGAPSGAAKKAHALQLALDAASAVNVATGRPLLDQTAVDAVDRAIDTAVTVTNVVHRAQSAASAAPDVPART